VRFLMRPASIRIQGPWQIAPIGLRMHQRRARKRPRPGWSAFIGIHEATRQYEGVKLVLMRIVQRDVDIELVALVGMAHALDFVLSRRNRCLLWRPLPPALSWVLPIRIVRNHPLRNGDTLASSDSFMALVRALMDTRT